MANEDEELELAAAAAAARLRLRSAPAVAPQADPGFFGGLVGNGISDIAGAVGSGVRNTVKGIGALGSGIINRMEQPEYRAMGLMALPSAAIGTMYEGADTPYKAIDRTGEIASSVFPGGMTAYQAAKDYVLEDGVPKTAGQYGEMARQDIANWGVGAAAVPVARAALGAGKGIYQGARDYVKGGMPERNILAEVAPNQEIYANTLDVGKNNTNFEANLVKRSGDYHQEFTTANPVAGIDPSTGRAGFLQFRQNLADIEQSANTARANTIKQAAGVEATAPGQGVVFQDIATDVSLPNGKTSSLSLIERTMPEGGKGVAVATDYVRSKFGVVDEVKPSGTNYTGTPGSPGRPLSVTELNDLRMGIDQELRGLSAYDVNTPHPTLTPSAIDATAAAFKHYRGQIDSLLKDRLRGLVGEEAAAAFDAAGGQIGMAKTYGAIAERFQGQTGQGFTPGSAKAMPPGNLLGSKGYLEKMQDMLPGENTSVKMKALAREQKALADLQYLVGINDGTVAMPAPRSWAQIKTSAQHLTNVGNIAVGLGLVPSIQVLTQLPDEQAKQVIGAVASVAPEVFAPAPDNLNVIDDKFVDPMGKETHIASNIDGSLKDQAMIVHGANRNKYVPKQGAKPPAMRAPMPAPAPNLNQINRVLGSSLRRDFSFNGEADAMVQESEASKQINALERLTGGNGYRH